MIEDVENFLSGSLRYYSDAAKSGLTPTEKAGRYISDHGKEIDIFEDIQSKTNANLNSKILDVGSGCGPLVFKLIEAFPNLTIMDQANVIDEVQDVLSRAGKAKARALTGIFPNDFEDFDLRYDVIICYGVLHYINKWSEFLTPMVNLLVDGGVLLLGEIPNSSKKDRWSKTGLKKEIDTNINSNALQPNKVVEQLIGERPIYDDKRLLEILKYFREMGHESYLLERNDKLPFNYSREDIIIRKARK